MAFIVTFVALVCLVNAVKADGRSGRIVGGTNTSTFVHTHQVSLTINGHHFCGGSVIGESWVVTAAHCVSWPGAENLEIVVDRDDPDFVRHYNASRIVTHPDYVEGNTNYGFCPNDIALLETDVPIEWDYYYKIDLPQANQSFVDQICVITGWGYLGYENGSGVKTEVLQETDGEIIDECECTKFYGSSYNHDWNICIHNTETGSCNGDSGGPLVCGDVLVGVTSFGIIYCGTEHPSVYTRLTFFLDWINSTMSGEVDTC